MRPGDAIEAGEVFPQGIFTPQFAFARKKDLIGLCFRQALLHAVAVLEGALGWGGCCTAAKHYQKDQSRNVVTSRHKGGGLCFLPKRYAKNRIR